MTNQEIELIAKNDKYINYCKKHTDYDDVLWKDLHQEMMIRVIENKKKVKELQERGELDFYLYTVTKNLYHGPIQGKSKLKTHQVGTSPYYYLKGNERDVVGYFEEQSLNKQTPEEKELKAHLVQELNLLLESNNEQIRKGAEYLRLFIEGKNRLKISQELGVNYRIVHESIENTINIIKAKVTGKTYMTKTEIQITLKNEGVSKVSYSGKTKTFFVDKLPATGIVKEVESAGFKVVKNA